MNNMAKYLVGVVTISRTVLFFVPIGTASADLSNGLVAHYTFEADANDSSGNGNNGTILNGTFVQGVIGAGLMFTGDESSHVEVPHTPHLAPTNAVTMAAWARILAYRTSFSNLIYKSGETPTASGFRDRVYTMWATSNGGVHLTSTSAGQTAQIVCNSPGSLYEPNVFVHFTGVIDAVNHNMVIYINGRKVAECPYTGDTIRGGDFPLRIGSPFKTLGDQSGLFGVIDEVRVYNRALSPAEVQDLAMPVRVTNPQNPIPCKASGCRPRIACQLAQEQGVPCSNPIDLFAFVPRRSGTPSADPAAKAPRRIRFAFGIANVPPGGTETVRLRLTRAGKKIVRTSKKRRLDGVFEIRNTPGDLINSTEVKIRLRK